MSKYFTTVRNLYKLRKITAAQVWQYADDRKITEAEAITICGPRPTNASSEN